MPFTPFHFGLNAVVALPLKQRIDPLVFILASVIVDLEPLFVIVFKLDYPLHGYAHTLLFGGFLGILWGGLAYYTKLGNIFSIIMKSLFLPYRVNLRTMLVSGVLGVWFHVVTDSILYTDIKPFYPFSYNPMYGVISAVKLYLVCLILFIPALIMVMLFRRKQESKIYY